MKYYFILLVFFFGAKLQSQELVKNDVFKKCKKELSKKKCLSDEDGDGILFYLDRCPKEKGSAENNGCPWPDEDKDGLIDLEDACPKVFGPAENNGCPWPDTDGDSLLDKDDKCPTIFGLKEYDGCPKPKSYRFNCDDIARKDSIEMVKLRSEYKNIDEIYNELSKKILDPIKKHNLKNIRLYINLINWDIHCDLPGCCPDWKNISSNYLSMKFWNKIALERFYNRKDVGSIMFSTKFFPDMMPEFKKFADPSLFAYITKYYKKDSPRLTISKDQNDNYVVAIVRIEFQEPYKLRVSLSDGNRFSTDIIYEYNGKAWNQMKL